jgi:hypothetical protein
MLATRRGLLILLALAAISCGAGQVRAEVVIRNDAGGDILRYVAKYLYLQFRGERVIVDGKCFSACTLALGLLSKDQRCFTSRAQFAFHAAWEEFDSTRIENPIGTAIFWLVYPAEIRQWLSRRGGLTAKVIYLQSKELAAMYIPCRRPSRALNKTGRAATALLSR